MPNIIDSKKFNLIDTITMLMGLVFILSKTYLPFPILKDLFQAIGTALFAAGLVSLILHKIKNNKDNSLIKIITDNRQKISNEYRERKYESGKIDILSIALSEALEELSSNPDRLFEMILFRGAKVRLVFLSPLSSFIKQRALEADTTEEEIKLALTESVKKVRQINKKFKIYYENRQEHVNAESIGSIEIKVIDQCPHFTIYRTDNEVLWGIYTSKKRGEESAVIGVNHENGMLFKQLTDHFDTIWTQNGSKDNTLFRYNKQLGSKYNDDLEGKLLK